MSEPTEAETKSENKINEFEMLVNKQFSYLIKNSENIKIELHHEINNVLEIVNNYELASRKYTDETYDGIIESLSNDYSDVKRSCKALESKFDRSINVLQKNIKLIEEKIEKDKPKKEEPKDKFTFLHFCIFFNFLYTVHNMCGLFF